MPILTADYNPTIFFKNGHINTIVSSLFRKIKAPTFIRKRIKTKDQDYLDVDFLKGGNNKIVVLCHGLEGSSSSTYILGTSNLLHANGYDIAALNYRSCNGEINKKIRTYHSGETEDLHTVINDVLPYYEEIFIVGFSLGGNIVLKYAGDRVYAIHQKIKAIVGVSVPIDLHGSSLELSKFKNTLYSKRFLKSLLKKAKIKQKQYPLIIELDKLNKVKSLKDFDESFTSVVHGFSNAIDYYNKCSSKQFLHQIKTPTLIINAWDDPFLSDSCYPVNEAKINTFLNLMLPKYGGHVGFFHNKRAYLWNEEQILKFIQNV